MSRPPELGNHIRGERLDLPRRWIDRPEHERVEAVVDEVAQRLDPPSGRPRQRLADPDVAGRQFLDGPRRALADQALHVEYPPDLARVATGVLGSRVDALVARTQVVAGQWAERRDPPVRLAPDEPLHARSERAEPDSDRTRGPRAGVRAVQGVVAPVERDDPLARPHQPD